MFMILSMAWSNQYLRMNHVWLSWSGLECGFQVGTWSGKYPPTWGSPKLGVFSDRNLGLYNPFILYIHKYRLFHGNFLHPGTLTAWVQNISQGSHYHGRATWKARPTSSRRVSWMKKMPFCLGGGSNVNFRPVLVDNKWPNKSSV